MACLRSRGIFEPAGIRAACGSVDSVGAAGVGFEAGLSAGFGVSAACPQAIPEIRSMVNKPRMKHLPSGSALQLKLTTALGARMRESRVRVSREETRSIVH